MFVLPIVRSRIFVALLVLGIALLVAAACGGGGDGGETPAGGQTPAAEETPVAGDTPTGGGAMAEISMVPISQFDTAELTIAADTDVTITVDNTDTGIRHNFAVYTSRDAAENGEEALAATEICNAPCTDTVTLNLGAGEYFFRCEVHPVQMTGTLVVE
jgi:plastocyanin